MLTLDYTDYLAIVAHALDGLPEEACGLLAATGAAGAASDRVTAVYPCRNAAASARVYEVHPLDHLRADRDAEGRGLRICGVYHSHTHTDAWPSPTDVAQAPDPAWHYVIVSLRHPEPVVRSFRIVDGEITEEPVTVDGR
ncbi:MAG: M67 family metallopeptidase [Actinomycetota bacterium]|jgi:[CysO sulfur-carrier protein]-S-L-cysteine hydrolase